MANDRAAKLKAHFSNPNQKLRPIVTSLNGDNSWIFSFPRPEAEQEKTGKVFFHAVHDPWLNGPTSLLWGTIIKITHVVPALVTDGAGVEAMVREIEDAASSAGFGSSKPVIPPATQTETETSPIDAIFVNLELIDHMHQPTLLTFNRTIPVFAAAVAAAKIRSWNHFTSVTPIADLVPSDGAWPTLHPGTPLPPWLSLFRLPTQKYLFLATAIIWTPPSGAPEALLWTPHGIPVSAPTLQTYLHSLTPRVRTLALLHSLNLNRSFGIQDKLGVPMGLKIYREAAARYWIRTHDGEYVFTGLLSWGINVLRRTLEWGLEREEDGEGKGGGKVEFRDLKAEEFVVLV